MPRPSPEWNYYVFQRSFERRTSWTAQIEKFSYSQRRFLSSRVYSGTKTPGWPKVKTDNSYSVQIRDYRPTVTTCTRSNSVTGYYDKSTMNSLVNDMAGTNWWDYISNPGHAVTQAMITNKHIQDIKDADFNASVTLAEGAKTIDMIGDTVTRLAKAYSAVKKGKIQKASKLLTGHAYKGKIRETAGQNWLALQYGWLPLLSDTKAAAEAMAKIHTQTKKTFSVRSVMLRGSMPRLDNVLYIGSDGMPLGMIHREHLHSTIARMQTTWEVSSFNQRNSRFLGLENPLEVVWELVPFSFVADWFLPIGTYISGMNYDSGLKYKGGFWLQKTNYSVKLKGGKAVSGSFSASLSGEDVINEVLHNRYRMATPPVNTFPTFKDNPLNAKKFVTSLALFQQIIKR